MKGIILAGGSGTRLYPITKGTQERPTSLWQHAAMRHSAHSLPAHMGNGIGRHDVRSLPYDFPQLTRQSSKYKTLYAPNIGDIVAVNNKTFVNRYNKQWLYTFDKDGKKIATKYSPNK